VETSEVFIHDTSEHKQSMMEMRDFVLDMVGNCVDRSANEI
jgi:hypothetical protein